MAANIKSFSYYVLARTKTSKLVKSLYYNDYILVINMAEPWRNNHQKNCNYELDSSKDVRQKIINLNFDDYANAHSLP